MRIRRRDFTTVRAALERYLKVLRERSLPEDSPKIVEFLNLLTDRWVRDFMGGYVTPPGVLRFRDPIYGTIEIEPEFKQLIAHPILQRLHEVRQLAFAFPHLPASTHTRFAHSLAVSHLATRALQRVFERGLLYTPSGEKPFSLNQNEKAHIFALARIAGLIHDAAHGPLGHSLDRFFARFLGETQSADKELLPSLIEDHLADAIDATGLVSHQDVLNVFQGTNRDGWNNFVTELIDSDLDVDRIEYVRRDAYFTGYREGAALNEEGLLGAIRPFEEGGRISLTFDELDIAEVEQFIYVRDVMYARCYESSPKVVAEWLATRAMRQLFDEEPILRDNLKPFSLLSDSQLFDLVFVCRPRDSQCYQIFRAITSSESVNYHEVVSVPADREALEAKLESQFTLHVDNPRRLLESVCDLEEEIANDCGIPHLHVVITWPLPNLGEEREGGIRILKKTSTGYERVPIFGDKFHDSPSELFRPYAGVTLLTLIRRARSRVRLFVHSSVLPRQMSQAKKRFYDAGVKEPFQRD